MFETWGKSVGAWWLVAFAVAFARADGAARSSVLIATRSLSLIKQCSSITRDTLLCKIVSDEARRIYRHCFVMCRTAAQFKKFARFEPRNTPLGDASLAARIRALTRRAAWTEPLPENQQIVFPGYKDLKEMSKAHRELVQLNIGHGWPSYFRISNARMMFQDGTGYQQRTHAQLNAALARGELLSHFLPLTPGSASIIRF